MLRYLLQSWLQNAAQQKLREKAEEIVREQMKQAADGQAGGDAGPRLCDVGVVFALGIESGGLEDMLEGDLSFRGHGFFARWGRLRQRNVVLMRSGAGREPAAKAAEALIDGHRPGWIISAGFAGGLNPDLARNHILVADAVLHPQAGRLVLDLRTAPETLLGQRDVHVGPLLTVDHVVRTPGEKRTLGAKYHAVAVDMETFDAAEICQRRHVRFLAVRVIGDPVDEELAPEVRELLKQKSTGARLGAALGAIINRPSSFKDMYKLRENALVASDRLATFLADAVEQLVSLPPTVP
jgi:adenosylhomocysteine nucleosidase